MENKLMEQVDGSTKPDKKGDYITNLGTLHFTGKVFLMPGHKNPTPTMVEWWLKPYVKPE